MMENTQEYCLSMNDDWLGFLDINGYVVVKDVASKEEVEIAKNMYWNHFESRFDVSRNDPSSWERWNVDIRGIIVDGSTIQCDGAWYLRGLSKVKSVFSKIWNTESLLVSMDSLILWKPWWGEYQSEPPNTEGLHVDQNPIHKPKKESVQGMIPLFDVTEAIGGLEVIPKSHLKTLDEWKITNPTIGFGDFIRLRKDDPYQGKGKLLLAKAGDLILWDSRTAHGGHVGTGDADPTCIARMSQTVCMTPKSKASQTVLNKRSQGFAQGRGFSHWPHEAYITCQPSAEYVPIELTPEQKDLLC